MNLANVAFGRDDFTWLGYIQQPSEQPQCATCGFS